MKTILLCDDTLYECNKIVGLLEKPEGHFIVYIDTIHRNESTVHRHYIHLKWNIHTFHHLYNTSPHFETRMIAFVHEFYNHIKMLKQSKITFANAKGNIYKHFASNGYLLTKSIFKLAIPIFCYKTLIEPRIADYTLGWLCC
jgi:hypothetical protein